MSNLGPQQQNATSAGLLQVPGGVTPQLQQVQDGEGNPTGLWLSSSGANVTTSNSFVASVDGTSISGSVARLISDGFGDYVSVKDFGAVGDGVTDDTVAIQNAINSLPHSGGTILFPTGTYIVTSTLTIYLYAYYITLKGLGYGSRIKIGGSTSFDLISISPNTAGYNYSKIQNLRLDGNSATGTGSLINTGGVGNIEIDQCFFSDIPVSGNGIFSGSGPNYNHEVQITNCHCDSSTGFSFINAAANSSDSLISNVICQARYGMTHALYFHPGAAHWTVLNAHVYGSVGDVVSINSPGDSLWFSDCFFDQGSTNNVALYSTTNCAFTNCQFTYAPQSCLLLDNSRGNKFVNCTFVGNNSQYAIKEINNSDYNIFNTSTLLGTYTNTPSISFYSSSSVFNRYGCSYSFSSNLEGATAGNTYYVGCGPYTNTVAATENNALFLAPRAGTIREILIASIASPGSGHSYTATLRVNKIDTAAVATIADGSFSASINPFYAVSLGQTLSIKIDISSGANPPGNFLITIAYDS